MVNVGVVKEGSVGYYTQSEGLTPEEYYSVAGSQVGRWVGTATASLHGTEVTADAFNAVMHGRLPGDDVELSPNFARRKVLGIDTVFRAPKDVSLMSAIGDGDVAEAVMTAHRAAVDRAVQYLEERAIGGREGKGGMKKVQGDGTIATAWNHFTSRAGDPLLHTHVVHANMIRTVNGRWVTLDSQRLYAHAKAAGHIYQAELRHQMTLLLGVEWGELDNGVAPVIGIDRALVVQFSKRRTEIEDALSDLELDPASPVENAGAKAAQAAALETRRAKGAELEVDAFTRWRDEAAEFGFDAAAVRGVCGRVQLNDELQVDWTALAQELAGPRGVTRERATFSRHLVVQELANRLPATTSADRIESLADSWITRFAVQLEPGQLEQQGNRRVAKSGEPALTTPSMLEAEAIVYRGAARRRNTDVALIPIPDSTRALRKARRVKLNEGQREMVIGVTASGNGVDVVIGDAGTGKTTALGVLREIYEKNGYVVRGAALAHAAKLQLAEGSGIDSRTLRSLLNALEAGDDDDAFPAGDRTVLVIDEAAMVSTRDMATIVEATERANAKLIVVGDPKQLPAIEAGGWFELLVEWVGAERLTENLRQQDPVEREIVDAMAAGDSTLAVERILESDKLVACDSVDDAVAKLVHEWSNSEHYENSLILAVTNREVDDLNRACRRVDHARRGGVEVSDAKLPDHFLDGEPVIFKDNFPGMGVTNRARGRVVTGGGHGVVVRMDSDGRDVFVPSKLANDRAMVDFGYASTVHVGQGSTVDACYLLAGSPMSREHLYVALSRGRKLNKLFATEHAFDNEAGFDLEIGPALESQLRASFGRTSAEPAATVPGEAEPVVPSIGSEEWSREQRADISKIRRLLRAAPSRSLEREARERARAGEKRAEETDFDFVVRIWIQRNGGDPHVAFENARFGRHRAEEAEQAARSSAGIRI